MILKKAFGVLMLVMGMSASLQAVTVANTISVGNGCLLAKMDEIEIAGVLIAVGCILAIVIFISRPGYREAVKTAMELDKAAQESYQVEEKAALEASLSSGFTVHGIIAETLAIFYQWRPNPASSVAPPMTPGKYRLHKRVQVSLTPEDVRQTLSKIPDSELLSKFRTLLLNRGLDRLSMQEGIREGFRIGEIGLLPAWMLDDSEELPSEPGVFIRKGKREGRDNFKGAMWTPIYSRSNKLIGHIENRTTQLVLRDSETSQILGFYIKSSNTTHGAAGSTANGNSLLQLLDENASDASLLSLQSEQNRM